MRSETACIALLGTGIHPAQTGQTQRQLLYEQGFTISGARNKLNERGARNVIVAETVPEVESGVMTPPIDIESIRSELEEIRSLLTIVKKE